MTQDWQNIADYFLQLLKDCNAEVSIFNTADMGLIATANRNYTCPILHTEKAKVLSKLPLPSYAIQDGFLLATETSRVKYVSKMLHAFEFDHVILDNYIFLRLNCVALVVAIAGNPMVAHQMGAFIPIVTDMANYLTDNGL